MLLPVQKVENYIPGATLQMSVLATLQMVWICKENQIQL